MGMKEFEDIYLNFPKKCKGEYKNNEDA